MDPDSGDDRWFDELSMEEQAPKVFDFYKLTLDLSHYKSFWYWLLALAGNRRAKMDQNALAEGERLVVRLVNSAPEFQSTWKRLCEQEPQTSRARPFLPLVLRSTCSPLPALPQEELQRRRAESWFFSNKCRRVIAKLNELAEHYRSAGD